MDKKTNDYRLSKQMKRKTPQCGHGFYSLSSHNMRNVPNCQRPLTFIYEGTSDKTVLIRENIV